MGCVKCILPTPVYVNDSNAGLLKPRVKFRLGLVKEDVHVEKDRFRNSAHRRYLCHFLCSTGGEQTPQPGGTGTVQVFRWKDNHCGLLQPAYERPEDFWQSGALRRG